MQINSSSPISSLQQWFEIPSPVVVESRMHLKAIRSKLMQRQSRLQRRHHRWLHVLSRLPQDAAHQAAAGLHQGALDSQIH